MRILWLVHYDLRARVIIQGLGHSRVRLGEATRRRSLDRELGGLEERRWSGLPTWAFSLDSAILVGVVIIEKDLVGCYCDICSFLPLHSDLQINREYKMGAIRLTS